MRKSSRENEKRALLLITFKVAPSIKYILCLNRKGMPVVRGWKRGVGRREDGKNVLYMLRGF